MTELNFILYFLDSIFLQGDLFGIRGEGPLGSADPLVKGMLLSAFAVIGFSVMLNLFNAGVRHVSGAEKQGCFRAFPFGYSLLQLQVCGVRPGYEARSL